jgi:hypothetical protein
MSAPISLQPAAANTARPARLPAYQTIAGAQLAAQRAARNESPVQLCQRVIDLGPLTAWSAVDGDARFIVELDTIGGDFTVRPISAAEVTRLQQAHLRSQVSEYLDEAERCTVEALKRPDTSAVRRELFRRAFEMRGLAREVELKLILGAVIDCDVASSGRDSRHTEAR